MNVSSGTILASIEIIWVRASEISSYWIVTTDGNIIQTVGHIIYKLVQLGDI